MPPSSSRTLILSASIGEGHDGPARALADGIRRLDPAARVEIRDFLEIASPLLRRIAMSGSSFHSRIGSRAFDLEFWLLSQVRLTRWISKRVLELLSGRRLRRAITAAAPDVIVSTYPGATQVLGALRRRGLVRVPVVAAITDLAALGYWTHPAVDVHLITHPESAAEVRECAPASRVECVRGLTSAGFEQPREPAAAREALGLPAGAEIVVVSGGGWAVGDMAGATEVALARPETFVVCLCGRNEEVRAALEARFGAGGRVSVLGFTDRISEVFAAGDVLVHSTAGLTVLEAIMRGCRVISYGWGHGHVRVNNDAFIRFGLADVAATRGDLATALARALAAPRRPDQDFMALPSAADVVVALAQG